MDILMLEQIHHAFRGLQSSLVENSEHWLEYFQVCIYTSYISLHFIYSCIFYRTSSTKWVTLLLIRHFKFVEMTSEKFMFLHYNQQRK